MADGVADFVNGETRGEGGPKSVPRGLRPKARLGWFQFSLRALLLFSVACSMLFSGVGTIMHRAHVRAAAVREIRGHGGTVLYDYEIVVHVDPVTGNKIPPSPPGPAWLRNFLGVDALARVENVIMAGGNTQCLEVLPDIRSLAMPYGVSDQDCDVLRKDASHGSAAS